MKRLVLSRYVFQRSRLQRCESTLPCRSSPKCSRVLLCMGKRSQLSTITKENYLVFSCTSVTFRGLLRKNNNSPTVAEARLFLFLNAMIRSLQTEYSDFSFVCCSTFKIYRPGNLERHSHHRTYFLSHK